MVVLSLPMIPSPEECERAVLIAIQKVPVVKVGKEIRCVTIFLILEKTYRKIHFLLMRDFVQLSENQNCQKGHQVCEGIRILKVVICCARSTNTPLFMMKVDVEAAFDRLTHSVMVESLLARGIPWWQVHAALKVLVKVSVQIRMPNHVVESVAFCGVRQGLPGSTLEPGSSHTHLLHDAEQRWQQESKGFQLPGQLVSCVHQSDDSILMATSKFDPSIVAEDFSKAIGKGDLDLSVDKSECAANKLGFHDDLVTIIKYEVVQVPSNAVGQLIFVAA